MSSTTFSYAQAAKGHTISQPSPQLTSSSAPPSIKDDVPTANTSVTAPSVTSNEAEARDTDKSPNTETDGTVSKQDVEVASLGGSGSSTASVTEQSVKTGRESEATIVEPPQNAEEKGSRSHSRTSRGNDGPESRKGRKGRKGRPSEKDAQSEQNHEDEKEKEIAKPILSEAPLPTINPWTKRLEAKQNAEKAKFALTPTVNGTAPPTQLSQDGKKRPSADTVAINGGLVNGASGERVPKKTSEPAQGIEQTSRRTTPRGSRASDKDDKSSAALPPVADASSWPDPKSAATAVEETTRKVQDKTDATDKEGQDDSSTNKKKNWVNLGIVPTVVFNTPLPPRGAKARGGARGAREAGPSRGGHGAAPTASSPTSGTDRASAVSGPAGPKPVTARPREGSVQTRATVQPQPALPHLGKHASSEGIPKDQRRPTNANNSEHPQASVPDTSVTSSKRASSVRDIRTEMGAANAENGQALSRPLPHDRANHVHPKGSDYGTQQYPVREGRPERGRGNGYRGRGGHSNGAGAHLPPNSYTPNGQYVAHPYSSSSRQNSAAPSPPPYSGQFTMSYGQPNRGRGGKWPNASQGSGRNGSGASFAPKAAQAHEFPAPPYTYLYSPQLDPLGQVIKAQVEYYFSLDNLCKDMFLRKQMDSQGFVRLSTIAGFKRMRDLVKDESLIRVACTYSELLEIGVGDDGIERLRNRHQWQQFILPHKERGESARNDGPAGFTAYQSPMMAQYGGPVAHPGYPVPSSAGLYAGFPEEQIFQPNYGNGTHHEHTANGIDFNGHRYGPETQLTQLSAGVPEYSPPMSPLTLESMTNFTDAQVGNMMVVLGFDNSDETTSDAAGMPSYEDAGPAHNGTNGISNNAEASSVNGVAANGFDTASQSKKSGRQPYHEIRREALEKRESAQPGDTPALMRKLYQFWSQMLLKDFNSGVYTEFRELALKDVSQKVPTRCGLKHLLEFYEKLLLDSEGQKPWPQGRAIPGIFQLHFQEALEFDRTLRADVPT